MPSEQDIPLYTTDPTTGEFVPVENGQYLSPAEIERRRYFQKKKQQQAIRHAANDERTRKFGNFTFCRYTPSAPFWADMSNADLVRLFYLSTCMLYKRDTLYYSNGRQLTADSLPEVLQTSESTCRRFLAEMEQQGYLQIEDGAVIMNTEYFARQSIRHWIGDDRSFIRVYHNAYRYLYRQLKKKQRGQLAYLIRMIPYLHEERNIVCANTFAHDADRITPLDDKRICEAVEYNPNQSARLMKDLQALHLENGQSAFKYNIEQHCFIIHPALFYEGDAQEAVLRDMNENSENT